MRNRFLGKPVILTVFGWPKDGETLSGAVASPENAARYLKEMIPVLNREEIDYLYFAMTDKKWKEGDDGGPGSHWGLLKSDGTMKESFRSMFSEEINRGMERPARTLTFEN
ncbi:MAG: glycosyl hydrolase family 17 protein [Pirellula sp.]|jgi:exo-beta-1,3-glucanase (GH17 family)